MAESIFEELRGFFAPEFMFGVFFPVLLFAGASLGLGFEITSGLGPALAAWTGASLAFQVLTLVGGAIVLSIAAYFIYNFQYAITQLFEGYWPQVPPIAMLRQNREDFYRAYCARIAEKNRFDARLALFPSVKWHLDHFKPTRLGNILRAAELYALDRYGMDSVILWTRLVQVLPAGAISGLQERVLALNLMLLLTALGALFTIIWCPVLALLTARWDLILLAGLGWPIAWLSYGGALQSAQAYAEQVKATFDLYRFDLLAALRQPLPSTRKDEIAQWKRLSWFFGWTLLTPYPLKHDNASDPARSGGAACAKADAPSSASGGGAAQ